MERSLYIGIPGQVASINCLGISCVFASSLWVGIFLFSIVIDDTYMLLTRTKIHVTITQCTSQQALKIKLSKDTHVKSIIFRSLSFALLKSPAQIIQEQKYNSTYIEIPEIFIIILGKHKLSIHENMYYNASTKYSNKK